MNDKTDIEPIYAVIGRRLRAERLASGWTQDEVSHWVGLSRTSITNVEVGRQRLMLHQIMTYADVLSIPLGELVGSDVGTNRAEMHAENATLRRRVVELERVLRGCADAAEKALA